MVNMSSEEMGKERGTQQNRNQNLNLPKVLLQVALTLGSFG